MVRYIHTYILNDLYSLNVQNPNWKANISLELAQCEKSLVGSNRVVHVWEPHDAAEKKACLMSLLIGILKACWDDCIRNSPIVRLQLLLLHEFFFHYVRHFIFLSLMSVLVYIDIYKHLTKNVPIKSCTEKNNIRLLSLWTFFKNMSGFLAEHAFGK